MQRLSDAWYATCFGLSEPEFEPHFPTLERLKTPGWQTVCLTTLSLSGKKRQKNTRYFIVSTYFPEVAQRGFDLILGNPALRELDRAFEPAGQRFDAILSDEDRSLRGSADLAYRFLKRSVAYQ